MRPPLKNFTYGVVNPGKICYNLLNNSYTR